MKTDEGRSPTAGGPDLRRILRQIYNLTSSIYKATPILTEQTVYDERDSEEDFFE